MDYCSKSSFSMSYVSCKVFFFSGAGGRFYIGQISVVGGGSLRVQL